MLGAVVLLRSGFLHDRASTVQLFYLAVACAGALLAWRFHTTRVLSVIAAVVLAGGALRLSRPIDAHLVFDLIALLLPANFILFSWVEERGFTLPEVGYRVLWFGLQAVIVALICRGDQNISRQLLEYRLVKPQLVSGNQLPQIALALFAVGLIVFLMRFVLYAKPVENGCFWSLAAVAIALEVNGARLDSRVYFSAAILILAVSTIETSYQMAYHDELTGLPARRAFNEMLKRLDGDYSIAIVDVDHFKNFNDTYGHDTGDEVLRMVASKLAAVTGGGQAFRCGGEEFAVIFPGLSAEDSFLHLEMLRLRIERSPFRLRGQDRRVKRQAADRRRKQTRRSARSVRGAAEASVTVSIGVAEPGAKNPTVERVIEAADKALYRAKNAGRNRTESDKPLASTRAFSKAFS